MERIARGRICALILSLLILPVSCWGWEGKVVHVADGDTITVTRGGERVRVRLYGIDTPEKDQYYGQNAKQFTSAQVMGKTVEVEEIDIDRYGRVVGLVLVGDLILNRHLVEYGYAWVYERYCKRAFCSEWKELEQEAREARRGLWKNPKVIAPWEHRRGGRMTSRAMSRSGTEYAAAPSACNCSGNLYNCSDFKTHAEAEACFDHCLGRTGLDVHRADGNGDGKLCESLP